MSTWFLLCKKCNLCDYNFTFHLANKIKLYLCEDPCLETMFSLYFYFRANIFAKLVPTGTRTFFHDFFPLHKIVKMKLGKACKRKMVIPSNHKYLTNFYFWTLIIFFGFRLARLFWCYFKKETWILAVLSTMAWNSFIAVTFVCTSCFYRVLHV